MNEEFHPVADIFPMLSDDELDELAEDIWMYGLKEPIWRHRDGRIIDGRNRWLACQKASVECRFNTYSGTDDDLVPFVISLNLKRRHLDESQRAMVAARIANMRQGARTDLAQICARSQSQAAELLNVSRRAVQHADVVMDGGAPELVKAVEAGEASVSAAAVVAREPKERQREIVAKGREEIVREANRIKREEKKKKQEERERKAESAVAAMPRKGERWRLIHAPVSGLDEIEDGSIDCIVTDPPYPREYLSVYGDLARTAARVLKPGGSCFVMVGQSYLPEIIGELESCLTYHWTLGYLTPGGQAVQVWPRKVNTFWKPVLWFVKGAYSGHWIGDVAKSEVNDNDKRFHHWGQSESGMADLIRRCSEAGQTVLDPFCGGGTTGVVAVDLGRFFIGADIDAAMIARSASRFQEIDADAA